MKKRFIFDEEYRKKYAKKDSIKWLIIGASALVVILIIIFIILGSSKNDGKKKKPDPVKASYIIKEEIKLEAGDGIPSVKDYFSKLENIDVNTIKITYPEDFEINYDMQACTEEEINQINSDETKIDTFECVNQYLKTPATYGVTLKVKDKEHTVKVIVEDTKAPIIVTKDVEIYEGTDYKLENFISSCTDASETCKLSYFENDLGEDGNTIDYSKYKEPGTYTVKIVATDLYNNVSEPITAKLTITKSDKTLYTVKFDSNDESGISEVKVLQGSVVTEPEAPTRDGYEFLGWYLGNTKFDFKTAINKDITLIAKWEKEGEQGGTTEKPPVKPPVTPGKINVTSVTLDFRKINLTVGASKIVKASVRPSNATNKKVTWKSENPSIATVSNGKIVGVKAGTTKVVATSGGKSASVEVVVRDKTVTPPVTTCKYGDANYNKDNVLSVNLIKNNCASDPNRSYNQASEVANREYKKLVQDLTEMGFSVTSNYFEHKENYINIKNNAGTGIVGIQITFTVNVIDQSNPYVYMTAEYIIKPDGSRQFIKNNIKKNNRTFK